MVLDLRWVTLKGYKVDSSVRTKSTNIDRVGHVYFVKSLVFLGGWFFIDSGVIAVIESSYWREELRTELRWLRAKRKVKRWSEKQLVLYERKLMLVAFQIRSLLERPKVNDQAKALKLRAVKYRKIGSKPFTVTGAGWPEDRFDLASPEETELSIWDVCNQLIHYYWMTTAYCDGQFTSLLVFSDYKRHTCAYEFEVGRLIELFSAFGDDTSAICSCRSVWDEKKQDFVVVAACGPMDLS
jgi:hypothetical protein